MCVCVCVQCDLADKMGQEPVRDSLDNFREFENVHTQRILFGMCHRRQQGRQIALVHARLVGDRRDARIGIHEIDGCVSLKIQHFVVSEPLCLCVCVYVRAGGGTLEYVHEIHGCVSLQLQHFFV